MGKQYDDTNRIVLFKNDTSENPKRPILSGEIDIDGVKFKVSIWKNDKGGKVWGSGKIEPKDPAAVLPATTGLKRPAKQDAGDDIF